MLRSCNDDLVGVTVADGEHPCPSTLTDDGPGLSVEAAVGHPLLDARLDDNMDPVSDLESLDNAGARWQSPLS